MHFFETCLGNCPNMTKLMHPHFVSELIQNKTITHNCCMKKHCRENRRKHFSDSLCNTKYQKMIYH